jgi:hypothetical protein
MNTMSTQQWYRTVGAIGLAAVVMAGCASVPKPTEQIAVSNSAITNAARAGGTEYAPVEMTAARDKMNRANQAMVKENYEDARRLAEEAQVDARLAEKKAESAKARNAAVAMSDQIRVLREEINRKSK